GLPVPGKPPPGRIDVVNLSLGSDWSTGMQAVEQAVSEVVASGVTVVASAGNAGALPYVTGSPGSASLALSVASSVPLGEYDPRVAVTGRGSDGRPDTQELLALEGSADWLPRLLDRGRLTGDLVDLGLACGESPALPARLDGAVALIERGSCSFYDKLTLADRLGASAALVFTDGSPKVVMGCGPPSDCARPPAIPGLMLDRALGIALRDRLVLGETLRAVLEPRLRDWETDTISDFSSRGPSRFDAAIKPQLTAPGSNVSSVLVGSGSRSVAMSGTSMAGPAVAGVAALLWQRSRAEGLDLDAAAVGGLLMNYADPLLRIGRADTGPLAPVMRQGAGRVDARAALTGPTLVRSDSGIASLGFGQVQLGDEPLTLTRHVQLRNLSSQTRRYAPEWRLAFPDEDGAKGLAFGFEPERLELAPGATSSLSVSLSLDPARLPEWRLRGAEPIANEALFQALEIDGYVTLTEIDAQGQALAAAENAQLPFHVLPRRRACLGSEGSDPIQFWEEGEQAVQAWRNPCGQSGRVEVYGLLGQDLGESIDNPRFPGRLDIESVGLRYGPGRAGGTDAMLLSILVHTREARRSPADTELRVFLDLDRDGRFDKLIYNAYGPELDARIAPGRWVVAQAPLAPGQWAPDPASATGALSVQSYDLDETTSVLALPAAELGLDFSSGALRFDLAVMALDARADFPIAAGFPGYDQAPDGLRAGRAYHFDQSDWACLSLLDASDGELLRVGKGIDLAGRSTAEARLRLNCPVERLAGTMGLLMHYPDNPLDAQVELRRIESALTPPDPTSTPSMTPGSTPSPTAGSAEPTPIPEATATAEVATPTGAVTPATLTPTPGPSATEAPSETASPTSTRRTPTSEPPGATATSSQPGATASPSASPTDTVRPSPSPTAAGRFAIRSLWVSQAVQQPDNALPLVADRPAMLRVQVSGPDGGRAGGRVYGSQAGPDLPGAPLAPSNAGGGLLLPASAGAPDLGGTLNFELPAAWLTAGRLRLRLELLDLAAPSAGISDQRSVEVELRQVPPLEVVLVPLELQPGGVGPVEGRELDPARDFELDAVLRSFPLSRIDLRWHAPLRFVGNLRQAAGRRAVLDHLAQLRASELALTEPPSRRSGSPGSGGPIYLAVLPAGQAPEVSDAYLGAGLALASEDRPWLTARALALALGLPASRCGDAAEAEPDAAERIGVPAEDLLSRQARSEQAFDLTTGCAPAWISPSSWQALIDRLDAVPETPPAAEPPGPVWLVGGRVDPSGFGSLDAAWPLEGLVSEPLETGPQPQSASEYRVELEDGAGRRLAGIGITPAAFVDRNGPTGELGFTLVLPRRPEATSLVLRGPEGIVRDRVALAAAADLDLAALLLAPRRADPLRASLLWQARRGGRTAEPAARLFLRARSMDGRWQSLAAAAVSS
ncbi:MAG: S8 family serine peptidase, partial [Chloroflexi bacterium]|nr:S8 family serine peptidase [Chloroflexota bacterium]